MLLKYAPTAHAAGLASLKNVAVMIHDLAHDYVW